MTDQAPKPIADCPNPECKHFCAMYEAPFVSNEGLMHKVKCDDCGYMGPWARTSDEAIRLHNLLCRPQQSAEPVAWLYSKDGFDQVVLAEMAYPKMREELKSEGWIIAPLYLAAFPGPSELVEEMEKLAAEWELRYGPTYGQKTHARADDLRALITRHRGKS